VQACHDDAMSGHVGITKTLHLVSRHFQWENMRTDAKDYVRHCDACQVNKASTKAYAGKLQPLSIPGRRWEHITMDLIVKLPKTEVMTLSWSLWIGFLRWCTSSPRLNRWMP
jgi:hypothetical protein